MSKKEAFIDRAACHLITIAALTGLAICMRSLATETPLYFPMDWRLGCIPLAAVIWAIADDEEIEDS